MKNLLFLFIAANLFLSGCSISKTQNIDNSSKNNPANINLTPSPMSNKLDLSNQQLSQLPIQIFALTNLEELNISNNKITNSIQAEIRQLQNLKVLNASNNLMTGVPAEIGQLQNLQVLDLSNNQLTGLPYELGNLSNLKTLNISGNNYSSHDLNIITEKLPPNVNIIK
jgi:Leucine-rich repeat (LRR) protein